MNDEEDLEEMIAELYESYVEEGFDFNTSDTFDAIFKRIFSDAVKMTLEVLESQEEKESQEEE